MFTDARKTCCSIILALFLMVELKYQQVSQAMEKELQANNKELSLNFKHTDNDVLEFVA